MGFENSFRHWPAAQNSFFRQNLQNRIDSVLSVYFDSLRLLLRRLPSAIYLPLVGCGQLLLNSGSVSRSNFLTNDLNASPDICVCHRKRDAEAFVTVLPIGIIIAKEKIFPRHNQDPSIF